MDNKISGQVFSVNNLKFTESNTLNPDIFFTCIILQVLGFQLMNKVVSSSLEEISR